MLTTNLKTAFVVLTILLTGSLYAQDMPLAQILIPGEGWTISKFQPPDFSHSNFGGNGFYYHLGKDGRSVEIVSFATPKETWKTIELEAREVTAMAITPDGGTLLIGDGAGQHIWAYRILKDGSLDGGEKYITLRVLPYVATTLKEKPKQELRSEVSDIAFDTAGRIYAATKFGVQIFDPTGRLCGVLTHPSSGRITSMAFGGSDGNLLFIECGKDVYWRKLNVKVASQFDKKK